MIKQIEGRLVCDCGCENFTKAIPTTEDGTPSKEIVNMKCVGCGVTINVDELEPVATEEYPEESNQEEHDAK